ncbi:hypothetical protein M5689_020728 [Euphorbia peplus]|nr:hypothetical protein M5689_020728 [Euphorbia peplus]
MTLINISDSTECSKEDPNFSPFLFQDDQDDEATSPAPKSKTDDVILTQSAVKSRAKRKGKKVDEATRDRPSKKLIFSKDNQSKAFKAGFFLDYAVAVQSAEEGLKKAKKGAVNNDILKTLKSFANSMFSLQVSMTTYFDNQDEKFDMWEKRLKIIAEGIKKKSVVEDSMNSNEEFEFLMAGSAGKN